MRVYMLWLFMICKKRVSIISPEFQQDEKVNFPKWWTIPLMKDITQSNEDSGHFFPAMSKYK